MTTTTTTTITTPACMFCGHASTIPATADQASMYQARVPVQSIFPNLDRAEREQLISGIHPECWEKNFG